MFRKAESPNGRLIFRLSTLVLVALVAIPILPGAPRNPTERFVSDNTVISRRDPDVAIKLPRAVHYVGRDRFQLSDPKLGNFDACELYAFVDPESARRVDKFYWVQFEAYPRTTQTCITPMILPAMSSSGAGLLRGFRRAARP